MREEYDIRNLNPRGNPYAQKMKQQIRADLKEDSVRPDLEQDCCKKEGTPIKPE